MKKSFKRVRAFLLRAFLSVVMVAGTLFALLDGNEKVSVHRTLSKQNFLPQKDAAFVAEAVLPEAAFNPSAPAVIQYPSASPVLSPLAPTETSEHPGRVQNAAAWPVFVAGETVSSQPVGPSSAGVPLPSVAAVPVVSTRANDTTGVSFALCDPAAGTPDALYLKFQRGKNDETDLLRLPSCGFIKTRLAF